MIFSCFDKVFQGVRMILGTFHGVVFGKSAGKIGGFYGVLARFARVRDGVLIIFIQFSMN